MSADKVLVRQCNLFSVFFHDIHSSICFSFVFVVVFFFYVSRPGMSGVFITTLFLRNEENCTSEHHVARKMQLLVLQILNYNKCNHLTII